MIDYNLESDEAVILQSNNVSCTTKKIGSFSDELILTNKNIIYVHIGLFGKPKYIKKYSLEYVKMYNGKPQVLINQCKDGYYEMQIYTVDGQVSFRFVKNEKKQISLWIDKITELKVKGEARVNNKGIKGVSVIKNMVELLKETKESLDDSFIKKIVVNCPKCGAQIEGVKKQNILCEYCGNKIKL